MEITPTIYELNIAPSKTAVLPYLLRNNTDHKTEVNIKIYPMFVDPKTGKNSLGRDFKEYDPYDYLKWFSYQNTHILAPSEAKEINIKITPPIDANESDHYFSVSITSIPEISVSDTESYSMINTVQVSNLLVNVTLNGQDTKNLEIAQFKRPVIVDSFSTPLYKLTINNNGDTFSKIKNGYIKSEPLVGIGKLEKISIPSNNILVNVPKSYQLYGIKGLNRLGVFRTSLFFETETGVQLYRNNLISFHFPFKIFMISLIFLSFIISFVHRKKIQRQKSKSSNS